MELFPNADEYVGYQQMTALNCAGTITLNYNNEVLMIMSKKYPGKYSFCGGKVNFGEYSACCAVRETYEESGIVVFIDDTWDPFYSELPELGNVHYWCYLATAVAGKLKESHEGTPIWVNIDDVLKLPLVYPQWTRQCLEFFYLIDAVEDYVS